MALLLANPKQRIGCLAKEENRKMTDLSHYEDILTERTHLGPHPMERLKRVAQPTTRITDNIQRFDEREHGFNRAGRGDFTFSRPSSSAVAGPTALPSSEPAPAGRPAGRPGQKQRVTAKHSRPSRGR